jgi:hypothetical protein
MAYTDSEVEENLIDRSQFFASSKWKSSLPKELKRIIILLKIYYTESGTKK